MNLSVLLIVIIFVDTTTGFKGKYKIERALVNDKLADEFDCVDRSYGYHAVAQCYHRFVYCFESTKVIQRCIENLVYNAVTRECDDFEHCLKQAKNPRTSAVIPPKTVRHDISIGEANFDCKDKRNLGYVFEKCPNKFLTCFNQEKKVQFCEHGLVFNAETQQCDEYERCMKCANISEASGDFSVVDTAFAAGCLRTGFGLQAEICKNKMRGLHYSSGCTHSFFFCYAGYTTKYNCPDGLFFDKQKTLCAKKDTIPECAGLEVPVPPSPHVLPAILADSDYCKNKETGFYGVGCNSFWYSCTMGITYKFNCPKGMLYDVKKHICAWKDEIAACRTAAASATHPNVIDDSITTSDRFDTFCKNKTVGFYADGCSNTFYSCNNGHGAKFSCPDQFLFHHEIIGCTGHVFGCQMQNEFAPAIGTRPFILAGDNCKEKENGFYGENCNSFFYSCTDGVTYKYNCPRGSFYDKEKKDCPLKEDIPACGKATVPTVHDDAIVANSIAPSNPSESGYDCNGKRNGFQGNHCSTVFYFCKNGTTYKLRCPVGTLYDVDAHNCVLKSETCSGQGLAESDKRANGEGKNTFDILCEQLKDGYFAHGCESFVVRCINGTYTREFPCARGDNFDSQTYTCKNWKNIDACQMPDMRRHYIF